MRRYGLYVKFAVLFAVIIVALLAVNIAWSTCTQQAQTEREMLETAQVLTRQMDAIWDFMEANQSQFVTRPDGTYRLYCVVAAKSVSKIFSKDSDYIVHYTNTTTRKDGDAPDAFEREALDALKADENLESYYATTTDKNGRDVFRYVEPLYITQSCLECHGEPAGELDMMGYPKEGQKIGDIAGAASVIMPAGTYKDNVRNNIVQNSIVFALVVLCGLAVIFWGISRLVTAPLKKLDAAAEQIENYRFDVSLEGIGNRDEVEDLASRFDSMAGKLQSLYSNLEDQVEERTAQLLVANELLQEESQNKSNVLTIMSHELRTPLTSVLAFTEIWEKNYVPRDEDESKIVHETKVNSQVILGMVNNILEMARLEAGKSEVVYEPIDLGDLVQVVKDSTYSLAEKKHIAITSKVDHRVPVISADSEKIRRILENLISNAIKFTQEGGCVDIAVTYRQGEDQVCFTVKDNGRGIGFDDLPYIFDSFVQGKDRREHIGGGSGLGLAVVKELAELHGGTVEVKSSYGEGSTFEVCIPVGNNGREELQ